MSNKIKTAVIGVGNMGQYHARVYSEISNLVAVVDKNEKVGRKIASQYDAKFYDDYNEMVVSEQPEAISVVTPTKSHRQVALELLKKKIPILVEKPIADNFEDALEIERTAKENKTFLMVGHIERFNPAVIKVKQMIEKGELGKVVSVVARRVGGFSRQVREADIGVDLAIHDIDIVNFLLSDEPLKVMVSRRKNHNPNKADSIEFFMTYKNATAFIQANWITPVKIRKLNITGTEGYLEMDYISQQITFYKSIYEKYKEIGSDFSEFILKFSDPEKIDVPIVKKEPLEEELKYFIWCIQNNESLDVSYASKALRIALAR